jgi:hydroxyacylglutathione hydrolase
MSVEVSAMLDIVPIPAFADNYIWAMVAGRNCVVVDPGDAAPVLAFLEARQLTLTAILITHHHADHIGGVNELTGRWPIPVYGPAAENIDCVTHALGEGDTVALPAFVDQPFRVIEVPGHTRGHIAYVSGDILFCGDTLFAAGCGRLFEGTAAQLHHSLTRLAALPETTRVYCTHEYTLSNLRFALAVDADNSDLLARSFVEHERRARGEPTLPSTIALERATNPFLRCATSTVAASARTFADGQTLTEANLHSAVVSNEVRVFAALRQWKNDFRG